MKSFELFQFKFRLPYLLAKFLKLLHLSNEITLFSLFIAMRYFSLFLVFSLAQHGLLSQIQPDKTIHELGDLYAHSERFVDFYFKNTGTAKAFILRVEKQPNTVYQISSSTILPDSTAVVRIQVSEKRKDHLQSKYQYFSAIGTTP